jgi:ribosomal protein S18 acetylase RimI-like enzyme
VAEADGEVAGFIVVELQRTPLDAAAYVATIDVGAKWRRAGLGRKLLAEAEQVSAEAGARVIWLHVHEGNEGAIAFYAREGFACLGRMGDFYGVGLGALVYGRELRANAKAATQTMNRGLQAKGSSQL